jgi:hypothetical protein
MKKKEFLSLK